MGWGHRLVTSLFKPFGLILDRVPNLHIHRYSCLLSHSSLFVSWFGVVLRYGILTFKSGCLFVLEWVYIGLFWSDRCSRILNLSGLVV